MTDLDVCSPEPSICAKFAESLKLLQFDICSEVAV
jgi:hypothetical protein